MSVNENNDFLFLRMRQSEDRESVTTSIDSYPFSPSSPWAHALPSRYVLIMYWQSYCLSCFRYNRFGYPVFPQKSFGLASPSGMYSIHFMFISSHIQTITGPVSFAGFSSPTSQSQLSSSSLGPGSLHHHMQQSRRTNPKRKKKWFNIF